MNASEEMLRRAEDTAKKLREGNKRLRARIERLKGQVEELSTRDINEDLNDYLAGDGVCSTEADIDKAWACAKDADDYGNDAGLVALGELGIVACSKCGGSKLVKSDTAPCHIDCPACQRNGVSHGWVWKP